MPNAQLTVSAQVVHLIAQIPKRNHLFHRVLQPVLRGQWISASRDIPRRTDGVLASDHHCLPGGHLAWQLHEPRNASCSKPLFILDQSASRTHAAPEVDFRFIRYSFPSILVALNGFKQQNAALLAPQSWAPEHREREGH